MLREQRLLAGMALASTLQAQMWTAPLWPWRRCRRMVWKMTKTATLGFTPW